MSSVDQQIAAIGKGQESQFGPVLQIPAAALIAGVYAEFDLPLTATALWFPQTVVIADRLVNNPAGVIFGVKINTTGAPTLPFGTASNCLSRFEGAVNKIYVTLLSGSAQPLYLMCARNAKVIYAGNEAGAGTPDNATTNGVLSE